MQTWITDFSFSKSAQNLDNKRLHTQIYEGIHIFASLLDINNKLVNPKRSIKNHPTAKLWKGYELNLWIYIYFHRMEWKNRGYKNTITEKNIMIIVKYLYKFNDNNLAYKNGNPDWITEELVTTHRSVLIQKKPEHYRKLWPDVPDDLQMRYDWRKD